MEPSDPDQPVPSEGTGRYYNVSIDYATGKDGSLLRLPGLVSGGQPMLSLVKYFAALHSSVSPATLEKIRAAVRRFSDYLSARFAETSVQFSAADAREVFVEFRNAALAGTFNASGLDPLNLGWRPRDSLLVNRDIHYLTEYFEWLEIQGYASTGQINPRNPFSGIESRLYQAAYSHRRNNAFLGHIMSPTSNIKANYLPRARRLKNHHSEPPAFPDEHFDRYLSSGFSVGNRTNYRDQLIVLLMNKGGLRHSEALSLYVSDVSIDMTTGEAVVSIGHPSAGTAPSYKNHTFKNRADYLNQIFGLKPRNILPASDSLHCGWKSNFKQIQVVWFEPKYGAVFYEIWIKYLAQLAITKRNHPYAFINQNRKYLGEPLSLAASSSALTATVRRAGLRIDDALITLKSSGLSPHGHRHAYAQRLKRAGIGREFVQRFLNHLSPESQDIYTKAGTREANKAIAEALRRLNNNQ